MPSGAVRKVAASQTTVEQATVMSTVQANSRGSSVRRPKRNCSKRDTTKDAAMAETSLQALMRHQNQRRMNTLPVPAPSAMSSFQAPAIESW